MSKNVSSSEQHVSTLQIRVLGTPEVSYEGRLLKFRSRKVLALLLYLAIEGHKVAREKMSAMLWPESDETTARTNLRRTIADLRLALNEHSTHTHLIIERDALAFAFLPGDELDVRTVDTAYEALSIPTPVAEQAVARQALIHTLQQAIHLSRGAFMEGFSPGDAPDFDDWVSEQRAMWQRRMSLIYERLAHLQAEQGNVAAAIETVGRWLAHDPFQESAYQRLMLLYLTTGNYRAALNTYEDCRKMLARELRTRPLPETQALLERAHRLARNPLPLKEPEQSSLLPPSLRQEEGTAREQLYREATATEAVTAMVGRSDEYLALVNSYQAVQQGQARVVIVSGEAGIGKTRLAREFLGWAEAHGADILLARAFETSGRLPYQPLVESLRPRLERENAPDDLLSDIWLAELARLFPELRDRYPDLPLATGDETTARMRLYEALMRLGQTLAQRKPVVFFLDDLHWADTATLDVLYYAARHWRENATPILLLLTLRSESLTEWVAGMQRNTQAMHLHLEALLFQETLRLLETLALDADKREHERVEAFGRWLFSETSGQPFYVIETLKALIERGLLARIQQNDRRWHIDFNNSMFNEATLRRFLPPGVREVIRVRLNQLHPASFALLVAAAVLGRDASFEELCQIAELDEQTGLQALDELLQNRFLREGSAGETLVDASDNSFTPATYFFAHDKIRDVVSSEAGDARRRVFHRRALEKLHMAPSAERAQHALAAGLLSQAFSLSVTAGDEAMQLFAVNDASTFYEQALRLLPRLSEPALLSTIQHLYAALGRAYELTNRTQMAENLYQDMLTYAQHVHSVVMECAALSRKALLVVQIHFDFEQASVLLQQALSRAEQAGDRALIADVEWHLAQLGFYDFDAPTIIAHSQRALAIAREEGLQELMARSLNVLSYGQKQCGLMYEAEKTATEAQKRFETLGNRAMTIDCMSVIADIMLNQGRVEEGLALAQTAYDMSLDIGNAWSQVNSMYHLAFGKLERGAVEEALILAERCAVLTKEFKLEVLQVNSLLLSGIVQRTIGKVDVARITHQTALQLGQQMPSPALISAAAVELCTDYAMLGQWGQAEALALDVVRGKSHLFVLVFGLSRWYVTEALVRAGHIELATEDLTRWEALIEESLRHRIPYLRAVAILAHAQGQNDRAQTALKEALTLAQQLHLISEQESIEAALHIDARPR